MTEQQIKPKENQQKPQFLIACDFDGTMYRHDGRGFLEQDQKASALFHQYGGLVGINTGRSYLNIRPDLTKEEIKTMDAYSFDFTCGSSGAEIADEKEELFVHHYIDPETVREIEKLMPNFISFAAAGGYYYRHEESEAPFDLNARKFKSLEELADKQVTTMALLEETPESKGQLLVWKDMLENSGLPINCYINLDSMDVVPKGCSKAQALHDLADHFDIPMEHVYAIGDGLNDFPAIAEAGIGFAIASGDPKLFEKADYVVEDFAEAISIIASLEGLCELEEKLEEMLKPYRDTAQKQTAPNLSFRGRNK